MKNRLLAVAVLFFGFTLGGTHPANALIRAGLLGGLSQQSPEVSDFYSSTLFVNDDVKSAMKFQGGFTAEISILPIFSVEASLMLDPRIIKFDRNITSVSTGASTSFSSVESSLSYVTIPVIFRYWLFDFVSAGAGFYYSTATSDKVSTESTTYAGGSSGPAGPKIKTESDISDQLKTDWGLVAAAGIAYEVSAPFELRLDVRYLKGMDSNKDINTTQTVKFEAWQFLLGGGIHI